MQVMHQLYQYVGPSSIAAAVNSSSKRVQVESPDDVRQWVADSTEQHGSSKSLTVTFIVDQQSNLWIAGRHSEHVACARCSPVLSAGEMTFEISTDLVTASYVTNQSTGYCPQPESWCHVAKALDNANLERSDDFDVRFEFHRCSCGQINLIKDEVYECGVCEAELPRDWNFVTD